MATTRARPEFASAWWWVALYVLSGYLSYRLGAVDDSTNYIWLPTGVTVGAFMLRPVRDWPLLGGLFLLAQWLLGGFELGRWLDALLYAVDDVGAAALAVWLIQRTGFALEGLYFLRSVIFAGLLAGAVAALGDAAWLSLRGGHATLGAVAIGAAASFVGVLLVTPVLASWSRFRAHRSGDHERFDLWLGIACFVLMVASATLVFSESAARIEDIGILFSLTYIPLFLTVVVTILLGGRSGSVSMLVLALIAIGLTAQDDGPFAWLDDHHGHSLLEVQFYLAIASLLVLTVSTLKTNRERVHEQAARQQNNVALALAGARLRARPAIGAARMDRRARPRVRRGHRRRAGGEPAAAARAPASRRSRGPARELVRRAGAGHARALAAARDPARRRHAGDRRSRQRAARCQRRGGGVRRRLAARGSR